MELTELQRSRIQNSIDYNNYDLTIESLLEEYKKYKEWDYVSHSYKRILQNFPDIFPREED